MPPPVPGQKENTPRIASNSAIIRSARGKSTSSKNVSSAQRGGSPKQNRASSPPTASARTPKSKCNGAERQFPRSDVSPARQPFQTTIDLGALCAESQNKAWAVSPEPLKTTIDLGDICAEDRAQVVESIGKINLEDKIISITPTDSECQSNAEPEPEAKSGSIVIPADTLEELRNRVDHKASKLELKKRIGIPVPTGGDGAHSAEDDQQDGNRIADAQARTSACIAHFRDVTEMVNTLESENSRLRAANEQLERQVRDLREGFTHDQLARQVRALTSVRSPRTDVVITRRSLGVRRPSPGKTGK